MHMVYVLKFPNVQSYIPIRAGVWRIPVFLYMDIMSVTVYHELQFPEMNNAGN